MFLYLRIIFDKIFKSHKENKTAQDELIGKWRNYDDGSGLAMLFGWGIEFQDFGKGQCYSWDSKSSENLDFEWIRLDENTIKIRINEQDWETIEYVIVKCVGAYERKLKKLSRVNRDDFWSSHESMYKSI